MNADNPTPRIGFSQMKDFIGKRIIFVGKVENIEAGTVTLQAPDGSRVRVHANSPYDTAYVEVTGTVLDPESIREESHVHYGDAFGKQAAVLVPLSLHVLLPFWPCCCVARVRIICLGYQGVVASCRCLAQGLATSSCLPHCLCCVSLRRTDLGLYSEFLKLANGPHADLFYARNFS